MSWTHSSKLLALGVLLALALGVAGTAAAVSFTDDGVPDEAEVGETETVTVVMEDPFEGQPDEWTVAAETELDDATVSITAESPADTYRESGDGAAEMTIAAEDGINTVEIEATGEVPAISTYDYENPAQENFVALSISDNGATLEEWSVHRFTESSKEARQKIDEASEKVDDEDELTTAISLYNSEDFDQSIVEAENVIEDAESEEQTQQLLIYGGIAVVLIAIVGGGVYVYQQRQQDTNKLQ